MIVRDPNFVKAVFCKSEALYNLCNFEYALLGYLKGSRLAPDGEGFKLGHIKCKKTITNSLKEDVFDISGLDGHLVEAFLNSLCIKTSLRKNYQGLNNNTVLIDSSSS